ncbi:MAG: hypothetical protein N3B21_03435 [Clostridia bacterium]|nr:hypothetical protein [Clostridia bacterium]
MRNADILFESYNMVVEESYNKIFESCSKEEDILKIKDESIVEHLKKDIDIWEDVPISDLNGMSPRAFIESIEGYEAVVELFLLGAKLTDRDLPEIFLEKLRSYGDKAIEKLVEFATDNSMISNEDTVYIPVMAVRILGKWKVENSVGKLIKTLYNCEEDSELIMEEIVDAFVSIGEASIEPILHKVENAGNIGYVEEYLLNALSILGKKYKSDKLFKCLKSAFLGMDNKVLGAVYLGEYGDGKAIPALRGYIEKNIRHIDYETFAEIKATIQKLGGDISDLNFKGRSK